MVNLPYRGELGDRIPLPRLEKRCDEHGIVNDWWNAEGRKQCDQATMCESAQRVDDAPKSDEALSSRTPVNPLASADSGGARISIGRSWILCVRKATRRTIGAMATRRASASFYPLFRARVRLR